MIGPSARTVLRVVGFAMLALGLLEVLRLAYDAINGPTQQVYAGLIISSAFGVLEPMAIGGALLALLSIDERLERKA